MPIPPLRTVRFLEGAILPWLRGALQGFGATLALERERWVLWLPASLGLGIGVYFLLPAEPPLWSGGTALAVCVTMGVLVRRRTVPLLTALALGMAAAGFAVAQWRTAAVEAPTLTKRLRPTGVTGRVVKVEILASGSRVTLERLNIGRLAPKDTPERVRLRLRGRQPDVEPGDWLKLLAVLTPPPPPAAPGAFDFQRQSYFRRLGGVGFSLGAASVTRRAGSEGGFILALVRLRQHISQRVLAGLEGTPGTIAAALMTGTRGAIPADVLAAIRNSGLAHLLAISGLHIGLVARILFFSLRGALALVPPLVLRYPIKKWAAAAAIPGALAYALIAGATVPTQRAFLMIGLVLLAVLFDRRGLSMRLVAWAAVIILVVQPESLLGASFQMSFAAVAALIAAYEVVRDRRRLDDDGSRIWPRRVLLYIGGVALTTVIAGTATAPFAIYHFNRFAVFGLVANLLAVPVTALWIMPWAVVAFLLMPVGLEGLALAPMGTGIEVVIWVAETVSAWPGAVALVPAMPAWGLVAVAVGGLWLCLWRRRWRLLGIAVVAFLLMPVGLEGLALAPMGTGIEVVIWVAETVSAWPGAVALVPAMPAWGLVAVAVGGLWLCLWRRRWRLLGIAGVGAAMASILVTQPPDVMVDGRGRLMAIRTAAGVLSVSSRTTARFDREVWLRRVGQEEVGPAWPRPGPSADGRLACDSLGCILRARGHVVALVTSPDALAEDCWVADVVVSTVPVRGPCPSARTVIDRFDLWREGAHVLWLEEAGTRVESVNGERGKRPWVVCPAPRRGGG